MQGDIFTKDHQRSEKIAAQDAETGSIKAIMQSWPQFVKTNGTLVHGFSVTVNWEMNLEINLELRI
jgi:hypothetical protein